MIETQHSPIMTVKVQEAPLHCLSAHPEVGLSTNTMPMRCKSFYMSVMENHHFEMCLSFTKNNQFSRRFRSEILEGVGPPPKKKNPRFNYILAP